MITITNIDGYKLDHRRQYPDKTEYIYSNWTPRSSRVNGHDKVVFFGLQYFIQKYLIDDMSLFFDGGGFEIYQYENMVNSYLGENSVGTDHIKALKELGYMPIEFKALPEGTLTPLRVPMFTVINTHPDFFWLVNYIETILSCVLWMPCTSATSSYYLKKLLTKYADSTCDNNDYLKFQAHDFSFRGMAGLEAAKLSGMGHLLNFYGTDTIPAIECANEYYPSSDGYFIGGSVPATEHSVMSAGGIKDEKETFDRLLDLYPSGIVSIVSDTWNLWNVLENILPKLKEKIMSRKGKLVIRPDSGNPSDIICGYSSDNISARKGVVQILWDIFGGRINSKGYAELDDHIGVIYWDAITHEVAEDTLKRLASKGFSSSNIVFGIGSFTYQYKTRDTYGFAMKATWAQIDGIGIDIYKRPITDDGQKDSARGKLSVIRNSSGGLELIQGEELQNSLLETVWKDGKFIKKYSFEEIRNTLNVSP